MIGLIVLAILTIISVISTGWLFTQLGDFLGGFGVIGWFIVIVALYFVLKRFTPFGSHIDSIIKKLLGTLKGGGTNTYKIIGMVLIIGLGMSYFGTLEIIDGWNDCTKENVLYAGLDWEIEGCPLGSGHHLVSVTGDEYNQGYDVTNEGLLLHSVATGQGKSLPTVMITAKTTVPQEKLFAFDYKLETTVGKTKISVNNGLLSPIMTLDKGTFSYSAVSDLVDINPDPNDPIRKAYNEGRIFCSTTHPNGGNYGRWSSPHCWYKNLPIIGTETHTLNAGDELIIILESSTDENGYALANLNVYTENVPILSDDVVEENTGTVKNLGSTTFSLISKIKLWFSNMFSNIINLF